MIGEDSDEEAETVANYQEFVRNIKRAKLVKADF